MNRRRFLKYAGAGAVALGGAATAYYLCGAGLRRAIEARILGKNRPPVADFIRRPFFLNPTDQQTIEFTNTSYDADNDPLRCDWYVDGQPASTQRDFSVRLPVGEHLVEMRVSDGFAVRSHTQSMAVDPDQIYPTRPLHLGYKGITYFAGPVPPDWLGIPNPTHIAMDEQLDAIRNELGCNAIIISGGEDYEDKLIECGRMAIEKGFERIHIQPRYMGASPGEMVEKIGRFAPEVRNLRASSESVIYCIGHEFSNEATILPGDTWIERFAYPLEHSDWAKRVEAALPKMFRDIIAVCEESYGYGISYAAILVVEADLVPWENPVFESVGVDAMIQEKYGWTEDWIVDQLTRFKQKYHKPVVCMEAGCETFTGSSEVAGTSPLLLAQERRYDEDEQANWLRRECDTLNRARIDGYFYTQYNDPPGWETGYGLYNPDTRKRKKGFYMYKSYEVTSK